MGALDDFYNGKIAVVTGAASGIGRAIARRLDQHGARVHCADINGSAAAALAGELTHATAHALDVTDPSAVQALADRIYAGDGHVDLLFNNAGIGHAARFLDTELEDWRTVMDVNFMGVVHGIEAFLPRMVAQPAISHIINTASGAGLIPHPNMAVYTASKHAIVGLSTSLAAELGDSNVRFTVLCPGVINTGIAERTHMRGETSTHQSSTVAFYKKNGAPPEKVALDVLNDVRRNRLFCLTPRIEVGIGWFVYRLSPRLAIVLMRQQIKRILGVR